MAETDQAARTFTISPDQRRFASWMTDVLIYTVVLNLFVEYSSAIVIDSFTISLLTAVLLKLLLDIIEGVEQRVTHYFQQKEGTLYRVLRWVSFFGILFVSKLLILEIVDIVFGEHVDLGHFVDVILLIIAMIAARELMDRLYMSLGPDEEPLEP